MNAGCLSLPTNDDQRFLRVTESGDFPITNSAVIVCSHIYDTLPLIQVFAVCAVAENGWLPGDQVQLNRVYLGTSNAGVSIKYNGNQLAISVGSAGIGVSLSKTSAGTRLAFTNANWRLRVRMIG
jgi:hypothetical protein